MSRHTTRGVVIHDGQILLMERWRPALHYFSIPGGGIESGEAPEQTVVREIFEETTVVVDVGMQVVEMRDGDVRHQIYVCKYISGQPALPSDAPEALHMTADNRFQPVWVPLERLETIPLTYWEPLRQPLVEGLHNGFAGPVKIVSAAPTR